MMEAVGNEPLTRFVPEIAQLVLCEVTVLGPISAKLIISSSFAVISSLENPSMVPFR